MTDKQSTDDFLSDFDMEGPATFEAKPNPNDDDPRCGFFPGLGPEAYHADPIEEGSLSNSGIKILLSESPLDFAFQHPRLNPDGAEDRVGETIAKQRGDVVHQLMLGKGRGYAIGHFANWQTKAAREFRDAAIKAGEVPILKHQFEEAEAMAEIGLERIKRILDGASYETEVAIVWREETPEGLIYCRGLLDVWCEERAIVLDPKITPLLGNGKPGEEKISRHMVNMGWDYQAGFYVHGIEELRPDLKRRVRFGNLMIRPEAPFTTRLLWPDYIARRTALFEMRPAVELFAKCLHAGKWPGYPEEGEELNLPTFIENRRLEMEINAHG